MKTNRSIPDAGVMPVLAYRDLAAAVPWLVRAFGCRERLRIHGHRVQLTLSGGALVATQSDERDADQRREPGLAPEHGGPYTSGGHALLVRVESADRHHAAAKAAGAEIVSPPADQPYGERQYTAKDCDGHVWTFSESIGDVEPASWGGESVGP